MAKRIGFGCSLKLAWLNDTVQLLSENLSKAEYKEKLNAYLSTEISSKTRLRKTREMLMHIWYYDGEAAVSVRQEAMRLLAAHPEDAAAIHLCMIYLTYPVVADICRYMGRLFEVRDEITTAVLRQKLYDEWGERGTLQSVARRVTLTLKEMDLLTAVSRTRYQLRPHQVMNASVVNFMLLAALKAESGSCSLMGLNTMYLLFPFVFTVSREGLICDKRFIFNTFSGQPYIALEPI